MDEKRLVEKDGMVDVSEIDQDLVASVLQEEGIATPPTAEPDEQPEAETAPPAEKGEEVPKKIPTMIPKGRFDEVNNEKKQLAEQNEQMSRRLAELEAQMNEVKRAKPDPVPQQEEPPEVPYEMALINAAKENVQKFLAARGIEYDRYDDSHILLVNRQAAILEDAVRENVAINQAKQKLAEDFNADPISAQVEREAVEKMRRLEESHARIMSGDFTDADLEAFKEYRKEKTLIESYKKVVGAVPGCAKDDVERVAKKFREWRDEYKGRKAELVKEEAAAKAPSRLEQMENLPRTAGVKGAGSAGTTPMSWEQFEVLLDEGRFDELPPEMVAQASRKT